MRSMGIIVDKKNIIMAIHLTIGSDTHTIVRLMISISEDG